jgi:hypothetical protein
MSGPPFTMSKYATELDLLRDKCAWLERSLAEEQTRRALLRGQLDQEEETHAALQGRCYEGFPSVSDGIFDVFRDLVALFKAAKALDAWLLSNTPPGFVIPNEAYTPFNEALEQLGAFMDDDAPTEALREADKLHRKLLEESE